MILYDPSNMSVCLSLMFVETKYFDETLNKEVLNIFSFFHFDILKCPEEK